MWGFLQEVGFAGAFVILFLYVFLKDILPLIIKNKTEAPANHKTLDHIERSLKAVLINQKEDREKLEALARDIKDLRDCHLGPAARDSTGGYRWYLRGEVLEAINKNLENIARQSEAEAKILEGFLDQLKRLSILA